ncbi:glycosyltransferase [bacterium]|nr:glycosyltransferase [bacterium]
MNYLKKCLKNLLNLKFSEYEIIIVNDGSNDGTKEFLETLKNEKIKPIHHKKNLGLSESRNTGIKNAKYNIVAFTDDDCLVDKNWLKNLSKEFIDDNIGFVIGQTFYIKKGYQGYFPERLVSNIGAKWPMGCNIAFSKKVFEKCGYFDDLFFKYNNEDSEMAIRAISKNFSFKRSFNAVVYHQKINWNTKSLLKSAINPSVWVILKKKYPKHYLHFNPPIKFGLFINIKDYFYILTLPILLPLLLIRYLINGKKDLKIFFTKWPILLILRRYLIYKEAIKNRVIIL